MNTTKEAKKTRFTGENRTERQKASDAKRTEKIKATRASRKNSDAITRELKIDWSKLSSRKRHLIKRAGHECNWLYNDIIRYINETVVDENGETVNKNDLKNYDTKIKRVRVKYGDEYRWRQLKVLSSQMKQAIYQQVWNALKALSTKKAKGETVGRLRYRKYSPDMCGIMLTQFGRTYKFVNQDRTKIRIQGPIGIVPVHGADDLVDHEGRPIPDACFASAVLCSDALGAWVCPRCGAVLDRQSNAAFVILALGLSQYVQRYASDRLVDEYARGIASVLSSSGSARAVVSWASSFDSVFQKEWGCSKRRREILTAVRDGVVRGWCGLRASDAVRLCLVQIHRLACLSPLLHADKYCAICTDTRGALASREHEANGSSPEAQGFSLG